MKKSVVLRGSAIAFGAALLVSAGSAALAAETEQGESQGVDVEVQIDPIEGQGALAMTVAASSTSLEENGSTDMAGWFSVPELAGLQRVKLVDIALRMAGIL